MFASSNLNMACGGVINFLEKGSYSHTQSSHPVPNGMHTVYICEQLHYFIIILPD